MTLLGKIFTGLIVMMSVLFLGLAISVYATHVNWRKLVSNPNPGPGEPRACSSSWKRSWTSIVS